MLQLPVVIKAMAIVTLNLHTVLTLYTKEGDIINSNFCNKIFVSIKCFLVHLN